MAILPSSTKDANGYPVRSDNAVLCLRFVARRYLVFGVTILALFMLLLRMFYFREQVVETPFVGQERESSRWSGMRLPPLYSQYHNYELNLPQHHWHAKSHEDEPKFFFVPGHSRGTNVRSALSSMHIHSGTMCSFPFVLQVPDGGTTCKKYYSTPISPTSRIGRTYILLISPSMILSCYADTPPHSRFVFYNYTWNDNPSEDYSDYAGKPIPSRIPLSALVAGELSYLPAAA